MIERHQAFGQEGPFWDQMKLAIREGVRDLRTGYDRISFDWLDPRVEGGGSLGYALTRALADAWRTPSSGETLGVVVMAGKIRGGQVTARAIPMDLWPRMDEIHFAADGPVATMTGSALARRLRLDGGDDALGAILGEAARTPGEMTVLSGFLAGEDASPLVSMAAGLVGESGAGVGVLFLYQEILSLADIGDAGGPLRNELRPAAAATRHASDSHASLSFLKLVAEEDADTWHDVEFRKQVFEGMKAAAEERGVVLTEEIFLNALAEGSPLRKVLPSHLTRFFPEAERLFWCVPEDGIEGIDPRRWDRFSPLQRLGELSRVKAEGAIPGIAHE